MILVPIYKRNRGEPLTIYVLRVSGVSGGDELDVGHHADSRGCEATVWY